MTSIAETPSLVQAPSTVSRRSGALRQVAGTYRDAADMNRSERIGFWLYVAMGSFCAAVLAAAITALLS